MLSRRLLATALLALLASAPAAAAETEALASLAVYEDHAQQSGDLALFFLRQNAEIGGSAGDAQPWLAAHARSATAVLWQHDLDAVRSPVPGAPLELTGPSESSGPDVRTYEDVSFALAGFQEHFEVHLFAMEGTVPYHLESGGGTLKADSPARIGRGGFGSDAARGPTLSGAPGPDDFAYVERAGEWVVQTDSQPHVALAATGDLVLEVVGFTLRAEDAERQEDLASGVWHTPVAGAPQETSGTAYHKRTVLLRLFLEDATLEVGSDAGSPEVAWAARAVSSAHSGPVVLREAVLENAGPVQQTRYVVPAGSLLAIEPAEERLSFRIDESGLGPRGTVSAVSSPASAALVGTGAILALGAAVGVGVVRRVLRLPALKDVETALEEGEYRKAARLAGRILARTPDSEEALLGRAIALTKSGRPNEVVAEVSDHLRRRPATDGTLHYVLGLAQLETGRRDEGQASLKEAVRLTPSLQADVAPRLGKGFSPHPPTPRESHGYA